jgi:hypothetical protein
LSCTAPFFIVSFVLLCRVMTVNLIHGGGTSGLGKWGVAQAVSYCPVIMEAQVCTWVSPCRICSGQWDWDSFFSVFFHISLSISLHHDFPFSYIICRIGQKACCWLQFRDIVSPYQHEQEVSGDTKVHLSLLC